VILAGGSGTRLWPLSREQYPKQLIELISNESPLSATARRLNGITNASLGDTLLLVCGEQHRFMSAEQVLGRFQVAGLGQLTPKFVRFFQDLEQTSPLSGRVRRYSCATFSCGFLRRTF
jgi:hypothetical protein